MPNVVPINQSQTIPEISRFLGFSKCWLPPPWIFKIKYFYSQYGQEGQTASLCQI